MTTARLRPVLATLLGLGLAVPAGAWPAALRERIARDARRLVPRTLAQLLGAREAQVMEASGRLPPELTRALALDLTDGLLRPPTLDAVQALGAEPLRLLRARRTGEGVIGLGALMRVPADLSDPIVSAGPPAFAPGLAREYYAFVEASLRKLPVTLHDPAALQLRRADLPAFWRRLHAESRAQADVLRREMVRHGRVLPHTAIDYRSPVFAVAQISWSRAVTAVAATWLATWRDARGDLTRQPLPREVAPAEHGPSTVPDGPQEQNP